MTVPPEELRLAADFPAATAEDWRRLALGVLRKSGAAGDDTPAGAVDDLLATTTYDGIRVAPLYTAADAPSRADPPVTAVPGGSPGEVAVDADRTGWDVRQRHAGPDAGAVREAVLADLENGVTSIWLDGVPAAALPEALDGVFLDLAAVVLDAGPQTSAVAQAYLDL